MGWGAVQTRHDPYFYLPRFVRLEAKVLARSTAKLRDFIRAMSGGSTPKTDEQDRYYADSTTGIPFVRVQNLAVSGELTLDDVKYVNHETHHGLLARSQVKPDDLLVKITGVGRMAIASVPPTKFEGNINQHIARIRTDNRQTSEVLAAWLNTDIAESLAKRRATGGTRPALDYNALRSIPVIYDEGIRAAMQSAFDKHQVALGQAEKLLASIDDYLLAELGITLPAEPDNAISNRIFTAQRRELAGGRFDPYWSLNAHRLMTDGIFLNHSLAEIAFITKGESITLASIKTGRYPVIAGGQSSPYSHQRYNENADVITVSASGAYAGYVWHHDYPIFASDCSVIRSKTIEVSTCFIAEILKLKQKEIYMLQHGAGQPHVYGRDLAKLHVPVPPYDVQQNLLEHIKKIRSEAKRLRQQAETELEAAKQTIEALLLGETP